MSLTFEESVKYLELWGVKNNNISNLLKISSSENRYELLGWISIYANDTNLENNLNTYHKNCGLPPGGLIPSHLSSPGPK